MGAEIRLATVDDAPAIAALHARAIHEGFLATLGPRPDNQAAPAR